jgi:predicted Holliday junction resolvase-like endonuclease
MRIIQSFPALLMVLFLTIVLHNCKEQTPSGTNSVEMVKSISKDSMDLKDLMRIGKVFYHELNWDSAILTFQRQIELAQKTNNYYYQGKAYFYKGQIYQSQGKFDLAHQNLEKSLDFIKMSKDSVEIITTYKQMSSIYAEIGDYSAGEQIITESIPFIPSKNRKKIEEEIELQFGYFASLQKDYEEALHWYTKVANNYSNEDNYLLAQSNIAYLYAKTEKFKESKKIYRQLLKHKEIPKDSSFFAYLNNAYQALLIRENSPNIDSSILLNSLKIRKIIGNNLGVMDSYSTLTDYYLLKKDTTKAIHTANELLKIAKKHQSSLYIPIAYDFLIKIEKPRIAKKRALELIDYKDSVELINHNQTNQYAKTLYESEQNTNENEILKLTAKANQEELLFANIYIFLLFLGIIIFVILLVYYFRIQRIKQQNYLQQQIRATEKNIANKVKKQISEGIKNTLIYIESNVSDASSKNKKNLIEKLENVYQLSRDISRESNFFQSNIDFPKELQRMIYSNQIADLEVIIEDYSPKIWKKISLTQRIEIYKALKELMTVMKLHSNAKKIRWKFEIQAKELYLNYRDNGQSIKADNQSVLEEITKIETRIQKIKGKFEMTRKKASGNEIQILIPIK